jgi:hypothetical protein
VLLHFTPLCDQTNLFVHELADKDESLLDIVRVHYSHRRAIKAGQICSIIANGATVLAAARGAPKNDVKGIWLGDERIHKLHLKEGAQADFEIKKARWDQQFTWLWYATDPANRTAGRLGVISFALGLIGLTLGLIPLFK